MSTKQIGTERISEDALKQMRMRGGDWFCYENHDMSSRTLGGLQFLQCGPGRTYVEPPARMPDTQHGLGWRYLLVGQVDLQTSEIRKISA